MALHRGDADPAAADDPAGSQGAARASPVPAIRRGSGGRRAWTGRSSRATAQGAAPRQTCRPGCGRGRAAAGRAVVAAVTQPGGFRPGVRGPRLGSSGARAFVKAVGPEPNPDSPGITSRRRGADRRGAAGPAPAPRLLASFDSGAGWCCCLRKSTALCWPVAMAARRADQALAAMASPAVTTWTLLRCRHLLSRTAARTSVAAAGDSGSPGDLAGLDPWALRNLAGPRGAGDWLARGGSGNCVAHTHPAHRHAGPRRVRGLALGVHLRRAVV